MFTSCINMTLIFLELQEQFLNMKLKRLQKKQKKGKYDGPALPETIILDIPTPRYFTT